MLFLISTVFFVVDLIDGKPLEKNDFLRKYTAPFLASSEKFKDVIIPNEMHGNKTLKKYETDFSNDGSGNYFFGVNIPGLSRFEDGELKNAGTANEIQSVRGQYSEKFYLGDFMFVVRTIGYTADENGYQPFVISAKLEDVTPPPRPATPPRPTFPPYKPTSPPYRPTYPTYRPTTVVAPGGPGGGGISGSILGNIVGANTLG